MNEQAQGSFDPLTTQLYGTHLIEASAGTGKTYNLTSLYLRFVAEAGYMPGDILVVTFTKAATSELKERLLGRLQEFKALLRDGCDTPPDTGDAFLGGLFERACRDQGHEALSKRINEAINRFDEAAIDTIHGFCQRALSEHAFMSGSSFDVEILPDESELLQETVDDYWRAYVAECRSDKEIRWLQYLRDRNMGPEELMGKVRGYINRSEYFDFPRPAVTRDTAKLIGDIHGVLARIGDAYSDIKDRLAQIILDAAEGPLNKRRYGKRSIPALQNALDKLSEEDLDLKSVEEAIYPSNNSDQVERYRKSVLDQQKGGDRLSGYEIFGLLEELFKLMEELRNHYERFIISALESLAGDFQQAKRQRNVLGYDDLLTHLNRALHQDERGPKLAASLRDAYPVALVDEFQDTDPIQFQIFKTIYGFRAAGPPHNAEKATSLFLIGDPKQAIYGFRGADVYTYLQARREVPDEQVYSLEENWRSLPDLIKGLNAFFSYRRDPFSDKQIRYGQVAPAPVEQTGLQPAGQYTGDEAPLQLFNYGYKATKTGMYSKGGDNIDRAIACDTGREIARMLDPGEGEAPATIEDSDGRRRLKGSDFAVLVRTNKQVELVREVLREFGIRCVTHTQQSVFDTEQARDVQWLLEALAEPGNDRKIRRSLVTPLLGTTLKELGELRDDEAAWSRVVRDFQHMQRLWLGEGLISLLHYIGRRYELDRRLMEQDNGEREYVNYQHLAEMLEARSREFGGHPGRMIKWLAAQREEQSSGDEEQQLRLESERDLVQILTVHNSKGLEFPFVFCPFLWDGETKGHITNKLKLEYRKSGKDKPEVSLLPPKDNQEPYLEPFWEWLSEELRLAYVALTRAQYRVYVSWAWTVNSIFSPLGYLLNGADTIKAVWQHKISGRDKDKPDLNPAAYEEVLEAIRQQAPDVIRLRQMEPDTSPPARQIGLDEAPGLAEPEQWQGGPQIPLGYRLQSYSSLSMGHAVAAGFSPRTADKVDEWLEQQSATQGTEEEATPFNFPRGADAGTSLHQMFEELEFSRLPERGTGAFEADQRQVVGKALNDYDIDPERWRPVAEQMVRATAQTPFTAAEGSPRLAGLPEERCSNELEFYVRVGQDTLASVRSQIAGDLRRDHHRMLSQPNDRELFIHSGYIWGYIDLAFEHGGRYYIVDYKSNHLGDEYQDYRPEKLLQAMVERDYTLQYYLYTLALHRILKQRLGASYAYQKHMGGAAYLFLRGIQPGYAEQPSPTGIYFHRPSAEVIESMDAMLK